MLISRKKIKSLLAAINQKIDAVSQELAATNQKAKSSDNPAIAQLFLQAKALNHINSTNRDRILEDIKLAEYKVFSQWGDDGIIQFLVEYLNIPNKVFIEFGVEDYNQSNTRFLLMNNNWKGLVLDASVANIESIKQQDIYWKYDLTAVHSFVSAENINDTIKANGFSGEIGILHIDIDGNDYWVWKAINCVDPVIVIMEYNSVFGKEMPWVTPYKATFNRTAAHHSNLYFGSSIVSLADLAEEKGYKFIGCNSNGNNAFFVRNDHAGALKTLSPEEGYVLSKFRESRDDKGNLTYLSGSDRKKILHGMEIFNTRRNSIEKIS
ncbi:MAG TPA: hypothetical protein VGD35_00900 [Chitinophaga sp.]